MQRLGLVGVGAWARRLVEAVRRRSDSEIVAFARASQQTGQAIDGARQYASFRELIALGENAELDALLVATNPENQAEIAEHAQRASVPAFIEKPLGSSAASLAPILASRRATPKPSILQVDYVHLFAPAFVALKSRIEASAGTISSIDTRGHNRGPFRGSSALYDYGTHDLAMCLALLGSSARFELHSARRVVPSGGSQGELIEARFTLDQCVIDLKVGNGADSKARLLDVHLGAGRRLVYDDLQPHPSKLVDTGEPVPVDSTMPLDASLAHFIELLGERVPAGHPACSLEFSLRIAQILDAIAQAASQS